MEDEKFSALFSRLYGYEVVARVPRTDELHRRQLEEALAETPEDGDAHASLATALYYSNDKEQAYYHFREVVRYGTAKPVNTSYAWAMLAIRARDSGDLEDAKTFFQNSIAADPRNSSSHLFLGDILAQQGNHEEARQHWKAGLRTYIPHAKEVGWDELKVSSFINKFFERLREEAEEITRE